MTAGAQGLFLAAGGAAIAATVTNRPLLLRLGMMLAGGLALAGAVSAGGGVAIEATAAAVMLVNLSHLAMLLLARRRTRFTEEERTMVATGLTGLDRAQARHLLDQGLWIDGRVGEVLTREDQPVTHLFYLAAGTAAVTRRGLTLATVGAPVFVGEITVLDESGATATVTLTGPGRFWCVPAAELRLFLRENPAIGAALETSFARSLAAKLRIANQVIAARDVAGGADA